MEEILDFDKWLVKYQPAEIKYFAAYDPVEGTVSSIGSEIALAGESNKTLVDTELALKVLEGSLPIHRCYVDLNTKTVNIAEIKSMVKVNDVLHRIIEAEYSLVSEHDIVVTYERISKKFTIRSGKGDNISSHWSADTPMSYYLTDYNDPNVVHKIVDITISDILSGPTIVNNIELPDRFSVYTKRLFRNYVLEIL
jgi:hypothetical protein